jgi:flagellar basal body-associated protein FliL
MKGAKAGNHACRGSAALSILLGMLVVLVVFMAGTNFVVFEYAQGAVRTAADEAARSGSQQQAAGGPVGACEAKAAQVMGNLLPGPFGSDVTITCAIQGNSVVATATGRYPGWLPPVPALAVHIVGSSQLEVSPSPQ